MLDDLQLDPIADPQRREVIQRLLNFVETLSAEVNRLKGEQGRPKGPQGCIPAADISSEAERRMPCGRVRQSKNDQIVIDREVPCPVNPAINIRFLKEKWYAPSTGRTYLGPLPAGYNGLFGPKLKNLTWLLSNVGQMSQPKLLGVVRVAGIHISSGYLGQLLIQQPTLDAEATAMAEAGLAATLWQQVDHTATRVNGDDQQCHILTTPLATVAHTRPRKDRLSTLDSLRNNHPRTFLWNVDAEALLLQHGISAGVRRNLEQSPQNTVLDEPTLPLLLDTHVANAGRTQRQWIVESLALAAYRAATDEPVVQLLLSDGVPQLGEICAAQSLCWVHDGRHDKKLRPRVALHADALRDFLKDHWAFYHALRTYQEVPTATEWTRLDARFVTLLAMVTGYDALDDRIAKTRAKHTELLQVLSHPKLPLHNNAAELICRAHAPARCELRATNRSGGVRLGCGADPRWHCQEARYQHLSLLPEPHRISGRNEMPSLADIITQRTQELNLGASWFTP